MYLRLAKEIAGINRTGDKQLIAVEFPKTT
jgi:hypothetical protein